MIKNLKITILLLLASPLALMSQQVKSKSSALRVLNAEVSVHYPGIQGAPIMKTYTITAVVKRKQVAIADTLWAEGFADRLNISKKGTFMPAKTLYSKGDTVVITAQFSIETADSPVQGNFSEKRALTGTGECLLLIQRNKKEKVCKHYLKIPKIKTGAEVFAP
jgi:hypothetical protein